MYMELLKLDKEVNVVGIKVETFPEGIGEAFDSLANSFVDGMNRSYYGITYCKAGNIVYYAASEIKDHSDVERANGQLFRIEKGNYLAEALWDWRKNVTEIKDIFHRMMLDKRVADESTCIEWYKDDDIMWCMIKVHD